MSRFRFLCLLTILFVCPTPHNVVAQTAQESLPWVTWNEMTPIPDAIGFAGPFAGISNDALIVAGGANFPGGRPWDGHPKIWHDQIMVLPAFDSKNPSSSWQIVDEKLPRAAGYGVALTVGDGVVCLGGGDATTHFDDAYILRWNGTGVEHEPLPPLPEPMAFGTGATIGNVVYLAGGRADPDSPSALHSFWRLDLSQPSASRAWEVLEPWPGPARMLAVAGAIDDRVYLLGGVELVTNGSGVTSRRYLSDGYAYVDGSGWEKVADLPHPVAGSPFPAPAAGPANLLIIGGDTGENATSDLRDAHPGFSDEILSYHAITDTFAIVGRFPKDVGADPAQNPEAGHWPPVTTIAVPYGNDVIIATGEARPGVRTNRVMRGTIAVPRSRFGGLDWVLLVGYLGALLFMGIYFARRERTTEDFFLAGRRIPWWAAGLSIFGTQLSAITFMAIPAKAYATNWLYFPMNMGIIAIAPLVIFVYLPFFRRLNITSAYEYLERRFNLAVRLFGSASFVLFQLGRMSIVIFLPAIALEAVTGIDVRLCIAIMGALCTVYTTLGGIEAVVWTDVLQVFVLVGGALAAMIIIAGGVDGGMPVVVSVASDAGKLTWYELDWSLAGTGVLVILLGAIFNNIVPYTTDQAVIQRYLTTRDERAAARAIWTNAILCVPASILFFGLGSALFVFYRAHPESLAPIAIADGIFPWFISQEMPRGLAGLVIAGVFAAAMSSLDSSLNSVATAWVTDFYRRFKTSATDQRCLALARVITVVLGVVATVTAQMLATFEIKFVLDLFLATLGLLGGGLAGVFALGMFTRRANATGVLVGAVVSLGVLLYIRAETNVSGLAYAGIGTLTCCVVGYLASLVMPGAATIEGLTIRTLPQREST